MVRNSFSTFASPAEKIRRGRFSLDEYSSNSAHLSLNDAPTTVSEPHVIQHGDERTFRKSKNNNNHNNDSREHERQTWREAGKE